MTSPTWTLEGRHVTHHSRWHARETFDDVVYELQVSDGEHYTRGTCLSSTAAKVWHVRLWVDGEVARCDSFDSVAPTNLPEAISRAERYLREWLDDQAVTAELAGDVVSGGGAT